MLRLTPFEETVSFKETFHEKLKEERTERLTRMIKAKFKFADSTIAKLDLRLRQLSVDDLAPLFEDIFEMKTLRELNAWIDARMPKPKPANGREAVSGVSADNVTLH